MKDGEPLAKKDNVELSHTGEVHTLKITKPKVTEIGSYICESKGKESSSSFRVVSKSHLPSFNLKLFFVKKSLHNRSGASCN